MTLLVHDSERVQNGHVFIQNQYNGGSRDVCTESKTNEEKREKREEEQLATLLEALRFDTMDLRYGNIDIAHAGTCRWLFGQSEYISWRECKDSELSHNFLWIKGKAGSGKSTLMKCALDHAEREFPGDTIISFFFNARGHGLDITVEGMYRSLIHQLLRRIPRLFCQMFEHRDPPVPRGGWEVQQLRGLFGQAITCLGREQSVTCFIDAFDECLLYDVRAAVEHFEELAAYVQTNNIQLRICFASRHYPQITIRACTELVLDAQHGHQQDIETYVHNKLNVPYFDSRSRLVSEVTSRCSGVFLWAELAVSTLNRFSDEGAGHSDLIQVLAEVPKELRDVFAKIMHNPDETLVSTLQWVLFSLRPLQLDELYFAIQTSTGKLKSGAWDRSEVVRGTMESFIFKCSRGLVETRDRGTGPVQLVHESVRQYLLDGGLASICGCAPNDVGARSHYDLYECCKAYVRYDMRHYSAAASRSGRLQDTYPLVNYAVRYGLHHLQAFLDMGPLDTSCLREFPLEAWVALFNRDQALAPIFDHRLVHFLYLLIDSKCEILFEAVLHANSLLPPRTDPEQGHGDVMTIPPVLLSSRIDLNAHFETDDGSLLERAVTKHSLNMTRALLAHGANSSTNQGRALYLAITLTDWDWVRLLMDHGVDTNPEGVTQRKVASVNAFGVPSEPATGTAHEQLLDPEIDARAVSGTKPNPLVAMLSHMSAARVTGKPTRVLDIVHALLDHGEDLHLRDQHGYTPMELAAHSLGTDIVQILLEHDPHSTYPMPDLLACAVRGLNADVVWMLLNRNFSTGNLEQALQNALQVTPKTMYEWSYKMWPFYCIVRTQLDIEPARALTIRALIDAGADVNASYGNGLEPDTALIVASATGAVDCVKLLVERGANLRCRSRQHGTAVDAALSNGHKSIAEYLETQRNILALADRT